MQWRNFLKKVRVLTNTAFFVAQEEIAFANFSALCDLQEKNGEDVGNMHRNGKGCKAFVSNIASLEREKNKAFP